MEGIKSWRRAGHVVMARTVRWRAREESSSSSYSNGPGGARPIHPETRERWRGRRYDAGPACRPRAPPGDRHAARPIAASRNAACASFVVLRAGRSLPIRAVDRGPAACCERATTTARRSLAADSTTCLHVWGALACMGAWPLRPRQGNHPWPVGRGNEGAREDRTSNVGAGRASGLHAGRGVVGAGGAG